MYAKTTATRKIANLENKIRAVQGGTSASKTISILIYLIVMAQSDKTKTLTSVVAESIPHLKRGAIRDFKNIMTEHGYWKDSLWNATDSIYTFETGSQIEFFSADQPDKLRGARRERLFINECNNVPLDAFDQLEVRTKDFVYLDWNPTNEFWFYTDILDNREDVDHIIGRFMEWDY
jgi:phage terminase large subunit